MVSTPKDFIPAPRKQRDSKYDEVIAKIATLKTDEMAVFGLDSRAGENPVDALNRIQISVRARVHTRAPAAIGRLRFILGKSGLDYAVVMKPAPKPAKAPKAPKAKATPAKKTAKRKAKK